MISIVEFLAKKHQHINIDFVDLGLPSGTEWASCNLGALEPEEFGLYYLWGSLEGHEAKTFDFDYNTYFKHYDVDYNGLTKLKEKDDAAYVESKGLARIPAEELLQELKDKCEYEWTKLNGVEGAKFTGPNGKSIFIPAARYCSGSSFNNVDSNICIWSLSLNPDDPQYAYYMHYDSSDVYIYDTERSVGFSIRPVKNN